MSTVSGPDTSICPGSSVQLFTSPAGGTSYSYLWSPATGLSSTTIANPVATPTATTTYTVLITDIPTSNTVSDNVTITVQNVPLPIIVLPRTDTLCAGDTLQLSVVNSGSCNAIPGSCQSAPSVSTLGSGTFFGSSQFENPFYKQNAAFLQDRSNKRQIIYTKAELNNAGIVGPSLITSLSFNFNLTVAAQTYSNFRISMGCTNATSFGLYQTGLSLVFSPQTVVINSSGWKEFVFDSGFNWDGESNVVLEFCFVNPVATAGVPAIEFEIATSIVTRFVTGNTDVCGSNNGTNFTRRPNMRFKHCDLVHTSALTYSWTPASGLSSTTVRKPFANPGVNTTYVATVTDANGCFAKDSAIITVAPSFNLSINGDTTLCGADSLSLISTGNAGPGATYLWSSSAPIVNTAVPVTSGYFNSSAQVMIKVMHPGGCTKKDSFNVDFHLPVSTEILTADTTVCQGDSIPIIVNTNYQGCQTSNSASCFNQSALTFAGTSAFATSSVTISPYGGFGLSPGQKKQYIFLASEMAGLTSSSIITSIGFNVVDAGTGDPLREGFTIKMSCTALSSFPTVSPSFEPGAQTVFTTKNISVVSGWNDHTFDTPFIWDGISNVLVEICWENSATIGFTNPTLEWQALTSPQIAMAWNGSNFCSLTTAASATTLRPSMRFNYCEAPPNPGYAYQWSPSAGIDNDTLANIKAAPNVTTSYLLTVTDPITGCYDQDSIEIKVAPNFTTTVTPDSVLCVADSVQLQVTHTNVGAVTYNWQPSSQVSNGSISNPSIFVNNVQEIISEVKSVQGCIKWDTLQFNVQDAIDVSIIMNASVACEGDSVPLYAVHDLACGRGNGSYCSPTSTLMIGASSNNSSQTNISPFVGTTLGGKRQYIITAAELSAAGFNTSGQIASIAFDIVTLGKSDYQNFQIKFGCTSSGQLTSSFIGNLVSVFEPKDITLTTGLNYFDFDNLYNWDGVSNLVIELCYENLSTGLSSAVSYSFPTPSFACAAYAQGTGACGFSSGALYNRRPSIGLKFCSYVPSGFNYSWSPVNVFSNPTVRNPNILLTQPGKYYLDLEDLNTNCILKDSIEIAVSSFSVQAFKDTTLCSSKDYGLSVVTDANNPKYLWYPGWEVSVDTIANPKIIVENGTMYVANVWDSLGCMKSDTVFITLLPKPTVSVSNDASVCRNTNVQLVGGGGNTYLWTPPEGLSDPTSSNPIANISQSVTYTLIVTNTFGCTDEDSVTLTVYDSPFLDLGPDTSYCLGGYLALNASSAFTAYRWQDNSTDSIYRASGDGKYWVVVKDAFNCSFSDTVEIFLDPPPVTDIRYLTEICEGDSVILDALNPGATFLWSTGAVSQQITVKDSGFYWVEIDDGTCPGRDSTNVVIKEYPVPTLPSVVDYCAKQDPFGVTIVAGPETYRYVWNNGQVTNSIVVTEEGYYWVKVTNGPDCEVSRMTEVKEFCTEQIFVPNSFTPNSDQINDVFKITAANLDDFEFQIFDRWGGLIYLTRHPDFEWNGEKDGVPLPDGTYVWKMFYKIKEADGSMSEKEKKGTLNLIR